MSLRKTLITLALAGCGGKQADVSGPTPSEGEARAALKAEIFSAVDVEADPCEDFYQYACGQWLADTPLPADRPAWGRTFSQIRDDNRAVIREMMESAARGDAVPEGETASDWKLMGDYYGSCTDQAGVDAAGLSGVQPLARRHRWHRIDQ